MIEVNKPTFDKTNEAARARLYKVIDKHIEALKAAFDEYMAADADQGAKRALELEQYFSEGGGDRQIVYSKVRRAIKAAYPKAPEQAPQIGKPQELPTVSSVKEAKEKGLTNYTIVEEGVKYDIPSEWKDPSIEWTGARVSETVPTVGDQNRPARMTYEGEVYYRDSTN